MSSYTGSGSATYSDIDVEKVVRRFTADMIMLAQSTAGATEAKVREWGHDVEVLAKRKYLKSVDITLLSDGVEQQAVKYTINEEAGGLESSRPGGLNWPRVSNPRLRITLSYTSSYTESARTNLASSLNINWQPSYEDTSHSSLAQSGGRDYASKSFGLQRKDFG